MKNSKRPLIPTRADLNRATAAELRSLLPGVGEVLATRITAHRVSFGPFGGPSDLARVPGIGEKRASRLWSSLVADGLLPPDPAIDDIGDLSSPRPHLVLASDAPPNWFEEPKADIEAEADAEAETTVPPEEEMAKMARPRAPMRLPHFGRVLLGAVAVLAVTVGAAVFTRAVRDSAVSDTHAEVSAVRHELENAQAGMADLRKSQAGSETRTQSKLDELSRRLDDQDRLVREATDGRALLEKRARKIEDTQATMLRKIGQVEDGLLWQKLVVAARAKKDASETTTKK